MCLQRGPERFDPAAVHAEIVVAGARRRTDGKLSAAFIHLDCEIVDETGEGRAAFRAERAGLILDQPNAGKCEYGRADFRPRVFPNEKKGRNAVARVGGFGGNAVWGGGAGREVHRGIINGSRGEGEGKSVAHQAMPAGLCAADMLARLSTPMRLPPTRALGIVALLLGAAGCADLPNDVGVRKHRSNVELTQKASHHPIVATWNDDPTAQGPTRILVNLTIQQAFFYRGETLIGQTNISSGRRAHETPPGKYHVIQKDAHHVSSEYGVYENRRGEVVVRNAEAGQTLRPDGTHFVGAPMPYFLRFLDGYGMHAGFVPRYRASHGCIRMPIEMAQNFFDAAKIGTSVEVVEPGIKVTP